ncbi:hypothetical protein A9Q95_06145 [Rhodobacterales bacterium 59_46_T64]|nr:hypothetical protein A9Q95_06145 [Rhodobacterales bacterium 59_46_T64]
MAAAVSNIDPLDIRAGEHGTLRVFDVNLPDAMAANLAGSPAERESALGVPITDTNRTEMFDVASLGDLGLWQYLSEGLGIDRDDVNAHREPLGNIAGYVLLLRAGAVTGPARLAPIDGLRLVALLHEERPQLSFEKIYSSLSEGILAPGQEQNGTAAPLPDLRPLRRWLGLLTLGGLVLAGVIWSLL